MEVSDVIGSIGVTLMLLAFYYNLKDIIDDDDISYILLNLIGSVLAFIASCMIKYYPFIILEGVWGIISFWGLLDYLKRNNK